MGKNKRIEHPQVWVPDRGHNVDLLVLPVLQSLWKASINTFFSCQGGPASIDKSTDKIFYTRAYVVVHQRDVNRACLILRSFQPYVDAAHENENPGFVAIRFVPCKEARGGIAKKHFIVGGKEIARSKIVLRPSDVK